MKLKNLLLIALLIGSTQIASADEPRPAVGEGVAQPEGVVGCPPGCCTGDDTGLTTTVGEVAQESGGDKGKPTSVIQTPQTNGDGDN